VYHQQRIGKPSIHPSIQLDHSLHSSAPSFLSSAPSVDLTGPFPRRVSLPWVPNTVYASPLPWTRYNDRHCRFETMTPCAPQPSRTLQQKAHTPFPHAPAPATAPTFQTRSTAFRCHHRTNLPRRPPIYPHPTVRRTTVHQQFTRLPEPHILRRCAVPWRGGTPSQSGRVPAYPSLL
jgi:hypothetical protein